MEESKPIFGRIVIIVISLLLLVVLFIDVKLFIDYNDDYKNKLTEKENYINDISLLNKKISENDEELNTLKSKYKDIDKQINNLKEDFFKKAKQLENKILNNETNKKIVYLTFDDGPYYDTTPLVLDILEQNNILATFFLLGKVGDKVSKVYEREYYNGHTLANHTYTHKISRTNGIYVSVDTFINDVKRQENFLSDKFDGYKTSIVRFPGGSNTAGKLKEGIKKELYDMKYGWVDWDLGTGDGNGSDKNNSDIAYKNIFDNLNDRKIVVILMHDYSRVTIKALPKIIEEFRNRNFVFLPLFYDSVKVNKN